jgi:serine protease
MNRRSALTLGACCAVLLMLGACNSNSSSNPGPSPSSPPMLVGCNAGATAVQLGSESIGRRWPISTQQTRYVPGRLAVRLAGRDDEPGLAAALARVHAQLALASSASGYAIYTIPESSDPTVAANMLRGAPGIAEARPVPARYTQAIIPNDPDFGLASQLTVGPQFAPVQWDMYEIDMPDAWTITEGAATAYIAVIDTGYDANNVDVCQKVVASAVFDLGGGAQDTSATAQDNDGHGTNVSAIAAASTNNLTRYAGAAWNVQLFEVRVFPYATPTNPVPSSSSFDIAAGIEWAWKHGAKVINLSLGGTGSCDPTEQNAINDALANGVVVIVAAGNGNPPVTKAGQPLLDAPADCHGVISVGASAIDDVTHPAAPSEVVAGYSNWGTNGDGLTIVAPGGDPCVTQNPDSCTPSSPSDYLQWITNNYSTTAHLFPGHGIFIAGTSQATPHVAGVAALMVSKKPGITPGQIKLIMQSHADDVCSGCVKEGSGRLNAFKVLSNT